MNTFFKITSKDRAMIAKRQGWKFVVLGITILCVCFIFGNSLMDSNIPGLQSGTVLKFLYRVIAKLGGDPLWLTLMVSIWLKGQRGWLYQPLFLGCRCLF